MDLTHIVDQLNEIFFFIDSEQESLYRMNYYRLRRLSRWLFVAYLCVFGLFAFYVKDFRILPVHVLSLLVMFGMERLLTKKEEKLSASFDRVRKAVMLYYFVAVMILVMFDFSIHPATSATFFVLAFPMLSLLYIDFPQYYLKIEGSFFAAYIVVALGFRRQLHLVAEDLVVGLIVGIVVFMCYWMVLEGITESGRDERALKEKGDVDLLTGLLNKISFERESKNYLNSRKSKEEGALLIIDFDNFKTVNDKYGHLTGDAVLKKFGKILKDNCREEDIVGRVGGDEFMVMLVGEITEDLVKTYCDTIQHELYVSRFGEAGGFSCSIGVAADRAGFDFKAVYRIADDALYEAKARGKACFIMWYTQPLQVPEKKIVYIASPDPAVRKRIKDVLHDEYTYMESSSASKALNEISLYQEYLESIYFDYKMPDMEESILRRYINSRPIFSKIPLHDVDTEL